ncbi:MAG TPA: S1 RNA-binding domain-containing protein, partial [Roseiarcus sp.]|nr:S1 RNA-binding domain-containing protein [Roseiarcus sp.]
GVTRVGLFVRLSDTGADGFIPAQSLGADYFRFEEGARALVGTRSGETFRLGDEVEVKLLEAAPFAGALRFEMVSEGAGKKRVREFSDRQDRRAKKRARR